MSSSGGICGRGRITLRAAKGIGTATITLDHATGSVNVISPEWLDEVEELVRRVTSDEAVKGVIITSAKQTFLAGTDVRLLALPIGR